MQCIKNLLVISLLLLSFTNPSMGFDDKSSFVPDYIFVGAGPVGLWTGVQLKTLQPDAKILFFEKYEQYKRNHVLQINPKSYRGYAKGKHTDYLTRVHKGNVKTNSIENDLLDAAKQLGIKIEYSAVKDVESLKKQFPNTRYFIGSDGSHSVMRSSTEKENIFHQRALNYIVDLKYEIEGSGKTAKVLWSLLPKIRAKNHMIMEYMGKEKNGKTPVTLRLFINKDEFEQIQGSSFKNPYTWENDQDKLPASLKQSISSWLNMKKDIYKERRVLGSAKIIPVLLQSYYNDSYAWSSELESQNVFLVGDAAFGVPFFRSLNNGLLCGTKLAHTLSNDMDSNQALIDYNSYVKNLAFRETTLARIKSNFVSLGVGMIWMMPKLPVYPNKHQHDVKVDSET